MDNSIPIKTLYLDVETTGLTPPRDTLVEVAIVDDEGRTVLNKLVNPERPIGDAKRFHGITDEALAKAPTLRRLWPAIEAMVTGCHIVTYNADFDRKFFPKRLAAAGHISCAMTRFAPIYGEYSHFHNDYVFKSLNEATKYIGYRWEGRRHRALFDALACRAVWKWMEDRDDFNGAPLLLSAS